MEREQRQKPTTYRFDEEIYKWLKNQAANKKCSGNQILRELIIEKMKQAP
jgi:predicted HicB family RNase H-like nuclease